MNINEIQQQLTRLQSGHVDTETAVSDAITLYKVAGSQINAIKELQAQIKGLINEIITETGQIEWQTEAGRTYLPRPSVTVKYDAKKLDVLCQSDPELAAKLRPFRIETPRGGSLTIR